MWEVITDSEGNMWEVITDSEGNMWEVITDSEGNMWEVITDSEGNTTITDTADVNAECLVTIRHFNQWVSGCFPGDKAAGARSS
jgi:hypothetical protein